MDRMSRGQFKTIEQYIGSFPRDIQRLLQEIRKTVKKEAPGATEAISYGIPTFKLNGNLVHFAAYASHIGFYPGSEVIREFKDELSPYKTSKGTIQFPLGKTIPFGLIKKIVKFRVERSLK